MLSYLLPLRNPISPCCSLKDHFFLYEVIAYKKRSIGLLCTIRLTREHANGIFCHEKIYQHHVEELYLQLSASQTQHNPILFITDDKEFADFLNQIEIGTTLKTETLFSGQVIHRLLKVKDYLGPISISGGLCLADGHHRYHAIQKILNEDKTKNEICFLATVFPLSAVTTKRKAVALNSISRDSDFFLKKLSMLGELKISEEHTNKDSLYFFANKQWYQFTFDQLSKNKFSIDALDIELLQELILKEVPEWTHNLRNQYLKVFPEKETALELDLLSLSSSGFILPSDSVAKIMSLARNGRILEPNSTFFNPKFVNGLVSQRIVMNDY